MLNKRLKLLSPSLTNESTPSFCKSVASFDDKIEKETFNDFTPLHSIQVVQAMECPKTNLSDLSNLDSISPAAQSVDVISPQTAKKLSNKEIFESKAKAFQSPSKKLKAIEVNLFEESPDRIVFYPSIDCLEQSNSNGLNHQQHSVYEYDDNENKTSLCDIQSKFIHKTNLKINQYKQVSMNLFPAHLNSNTGGSIFRFLILTMLLIFGFLMLYNFNTIPTNSLNEISATSFQLTTIVDNTVIMNKSKTNHSPIKQRVMDSIQQLQLINRKEIIIANSLLNKIKIKHFIHKIVKITNKFCSKMNEFIQNNIKKAINLRRLRIISHKLQTQQPLAMNNWAFNDAYENIWYAL